MNALSSRQFCTHSILFSWSIRHIHHEDSFSRLHCWAARRCHSGSMYHPRRWLISCHCPWTGGPRLSACVFITSKLSSSFRTSDPFSWYPCLRGTLGSCIHGSPKKTSSQTRRHHWCTPSSPSSCSELHRAQNKPGMESICNDQICASRLLHPKFQVE